MSMGTRCIRLASQYALVVVVGLTAAGWNCPVNAQDNSTTTNYVANIVGGVAVDLSGMLSNSKHDASGMLERLSRDIQPISGEMNQTAGLRKISLRRLEAELKNNIGKPLPDAVSLLAGLQSVRYVLFCPEQNDIILVGPAEGWKLDPRGYFLGAKSGRPVMLLDDLLVALRTAIRSPSALSCSINPTPEGIRRVEAFTRQIQPGTDPRAAAAAIEEKLGPQRITINGIPDNSHFARVMVAADYRMKRISMGLEPAPVQGLPAYTEMVKVSGSGMSNMSPRWWLEPAYQPLLRDEGSLAWEIRGAAVRCMTENDFFDASGVARASGRSDAVTQRWARLMTDRYQDLAQADPVFAQLQNCMDLAVVSSLIAKRRSAVDAGQEFPLLTGNVAGVPTLQLDAPKQVGPGASLARKGRKTMVAAGGVQVNPWAMIDKAQTSTELVQVHQKLAVAPSTSWWWD